MGRKVWTVICLLLAALCLMFWPPKTQVIRAESYLVRRRTDYQGLIRVWQVTDWRTPSMSAYTALEQAARRLEAKCPGVYVETESVDANELYDRFQAGDVPDLVSYPSGYCPPDGERMTLKVPDSLIWEGDWDKSVPWMATAAVRVERREKKENQGAVGSAVWSAGFLACNKGADAVWTETEQEARDAFLAGDADLWYTGLREASQLLSREDGDGFLCEPWEEDTPVPVRFQYLTAYRPKAESRGEPIRLLIEELLSEKTQKTVAEKCRCLSVIAPGSDWDTGELCRSALERKERGYCYIVPDASLAARDFLTGAAGTDYIKVIRQDLREETEKE